MSHKLLIVDDNQGCSDLYKMRFEYDKWQVSTAYSAEQALEIIKDGFKPDLILLDIMLPKMQGDELVQVLRKDPETADIKIVIMTAMNLNDNDKERICAHANACILKIDVLPAQLVKIAQKLVEK